jgi:hypothetical protein
MDRISQFFSVIYKRICRQSDFIGIFDLAGYGMPGSPMFHRSARIDRPAYGPAKPDRVENSANCFATQTARHGRNSHSSGIFTFFSFEEGSNFIQNMRLIVFCAICIMYIYYRVKKMEKSILVLLQMLMRD